MSTIITVMRIMEFCFYFTGQCGFLEEVRRSNVAITRARRHLALVGDSDTLKHEPFLKGMMDYCMECGEVFSAQQYISGECMLL